MPDGWLRARRLPVLKKAVVVADMIFCRRLVDVVEKVGGVLLTRNNRIIGVDFLNRTCAIDAHFESMLL